ncbi:MAG: sulfite exporter TauE/SafE family protein, partial [Candidatus Omnitrophota bacterium]
MPIIISFFLLGLSFGAGPCLASCGPLLISYLAGTKKNFRGGLYSYILFSAARISVYLAIGLLVFLLGRVLASEFLGVISKYVLVSGGGFIICVGVLLMARPCSPSVLSGAEGLMLDKHKETGFCNVLQKKFLEKDKKSIIIFGLIIGLIPCAPLLAAFSYMGLISKDWLTALTYSFFFGLGTLISPLLVLAGLAGVIPGILADKQAVYGRIFNFFCGGILVLLGLQLI